MYLTQEEKLHKYFPENTNNLAKLKLCCLHTVMKPWRMAK